MPHSQIRVLDPVLDSGLAFTWVLLHHNIIQDNPHGTISR